MRYFLLLISIAFFGCNLSKEKNINEFFKLVEQDPKTSYLTIEKKLTNFKSECEVIHYPAGVYSNNFAGIIKFYRLDEDTYVDLYQNFDNRKIGYQPNNLISLKPGDSNLFSYKSCKPMLSNICNNNLLLNSNIEYMIIDNKQGLFLLGEEGQYLKKVNENNGFSSGIAFIEEEKTIVNFLIIW